MPRRVKVPNDQDIPPRRHLILAACRQNLHHLMRRMGGMRGRGTAPVMTATTSILTPRINCSLIPPPTTPTLFLYNQHSDHFCPLKEGTATGIPSSSQQLMHKGESLLPNIPLSEAGVSDGDLVTVLVKKSLTAAFQWCLTDYHKNILQVVPGDRSRKPQPGTGQDTR